MLGYSNVEEVLELLPALCLFVFLSAGMKIQPQTGLRAPLAPNARLEKES